ncbi:amino acid ABC transporter ATP-binding protein [Winkia sp. UMB0889B]|uniref:amino acid ABC transporter ATP-binding protein n=1 Tax=Winkia sp. UMB0889B TaxID=3046315 RepID=UPI0025572EFC|nr:ATP-binding cassette domain-containing protein [Winkia sp. UMB0889B]MDK7906097.1 ATP-binding cassette domain-containing protein [Winkia sp. UMB0889B]
MISIKDLSKSFPGKAHALDGVSASFAPGKTTVIVGPSGSGKSTLLRTLNLLEIPDEGHLQVEDAELAFPTKVSRAAKENLRQHSAMVFQGYHLFPHLTVRQNVELAPKVLKRKGPLDTERLLQDVGMAEKADSYPAALSGGQAQRAAIARAMALEPKYLFCDEPTSALDPELAAEVSKVLTKLAARGQGLVVVTHDMSFARRVADTVLLLIDGKIYFDGTPQEFFNSTDERIVQFLSVFEG